MYSSDEYEHVNENIGSSASGSSAYGIGALDHLVKNKIKKSLDKNYDSEGNSIESRSNMQEYNSTSYKSENTESQFQNHVMEEYKKTTLMTRVNSDEAIITIGEIKNKLGKLPSSVENSPKRKRKSKSESESEESSIKETTSILSDCSYKKSNETESQNQNDVMEAYQKITPITRVNSDEAISTVSKIRKKLGRSPSLAESYAKIGKKPKIDTSVISDDSKFKSKKIKRPLRDKSGNLKYDSNILSEENVNKIDGSTSKDVNKFKRSRSFNTASTLTTREGTSTSSSSSSRNCSIIDFNSIDKNLGIQILESKVRPIPIKCDKYGQFINLESDCEFTDNDT